MNNNHSMLASNARPTRMQAALATSALVLAMVAGATCGAVAQNAQGFWDGVKSRGTLRCAYATSAPYMIKDVKTNDYSGTFLDMCKQFAAELKVEVSFTDTTWDNIIAGLQADQWDLAPALTRTPARAMAINYSIPVVYDETTLIYRRDNSKISNPAPDLSTLDVAGMKIGVVSGQSHDFAITERFKNAEIVRLPTIEAVNLALLSGRLDAVAASIYINRVFEGANAEQVTTVVPQPPLTKNGVAFGLPRTADWHDVNVLNIFLEKIVATGNADASMKRYSDQMISVAHK